MRLLGPAAAGLCVSLLVGCTALPVIETNVCGNGVLEPAAHEDCDTFVDEDDPDLAGAVCLPKGVFGACHFDCQVNADGQHAPCPHGMGCALDGICRRATDDFATRVKLSSDPSSWLGTLDFDGDGKLELLSTEPVDQLQQARFRLHYFDPLGALEETRTFPRVATRPIGRKSSVGDASDLIFSNLRIGMLPGRADRDWVPATFSSYVVPDADIRAVGVRNDDVGDATALAAFTKIDGVWGVYVPSVKDNGSLSLRSRFSRPVAELAGAPIAANINPGVDSPCDELVFAFRGDHDVRVLDLCRVGDAEEPEYEVVWRDAAREQRVRLPDGLAIDAGPLAADVDGDGHLDLLIGANQQTYVAHGDGTRLQDVAEGPVMLPLFGASGSQPLPMPLAAGDVSGDGIADFVLPGGVATSRQSLVDGRVGYFQSYGNSAEPWSMAEIADLNGNALPDIVAASSGAPGLTFLNGTGGPYQIAARLSSTGPLRFLTTGDFDGDLIGDVAFIEGGPPRSPLDQLSVAFGARDGTPLPAKRVAELSGVEQLSDHPQLGLDELFTGSSSRLDGHASATLTLFDGNPDRLPFAPYTLVSFSQDGKLMDWGAVALAAGGFTAPHANDVVALGTHRLSDEWNLWLIPNIGGEKQPPRLLNAVPPADVRPVTLESEGTVRLSVASAAADLEGDGFDEALWLMPQGPAACVLLRYDIDGGSSEALVRSQLVFDEPCATPELSAADLNGDRKLDLIVLLGNPELGPRRLEVLWNDGQGGFSLDQRSWLGDAGDDDVRAFSVFPPGDLRIAFVTSSALHIASSSRGGRPFDVVRDVPGFDDAQAVSVTDSNADQVSDVAVADAEGLWLVGAKLR